MKYRTIVADPPWHYDSWPAASTSPNSAFNKRLGVPADTSVRAALPYPSMTVEAIKALRFPTADNAHLYLWTTNRYLRQGFEVAEAWGFKPAQTLVWCKTPRGIGPGGTFAQTTEYVIFARRGSLPAGGRLDSTWFEWPRGGHSVKPDAFLDLVESVSPGPYLELFARRQRLGWDTWGDEALQHVDLAPAIGTAS